MTSTLPASSRSCSGSHPQVAARQRPSGRSHSTRTDPSTITSPTRTRSRTQIRPGIHGADQPYIERNHSPPQPLTTSPVQIRPSGRSHSTRTDPSTITSPTPTGSRTQIRPGIHGADHDPTHHNHSPPRRLTRDPVQISSSGSGRNPFAVVGLAYAIAALIPLWSYFTWESARRCRSRSRPRGRRSSGSAW